MAVHKIDYKFPKDTLLHEYETLFETKTEIQDQVATFDKVKEIICQK